MKCPYNDFECAEVNTSAMTQLNACSDCQYYELLPIDQERPEKPNYDEIRGIDTPEKTAEEFVRDKLNEKTGQGITLYEHYLAHDTTISIGTAVSWMEEYHNQSRQTVRNEELRPVHKCIPIAKASMGEGRSWWCGKLTEPLKEYPLETHCLHLKTQLKDVIFLCNEADFQQLQLLGRSITGKMDETWVESMLKIVYINARKEDNCNRITKWMRDRLPPESTICENCSKVHDYSAKECYRLIGKAT